MAPGPADLAASVVVATYNRGDRLDALFAALNAQEGTGPFEVIVVDDASTDDTPARLERLAATSKVPVRCLRQEENAGPAAARNRGWRASAAPVVCFTDDDCVPQAGWLAGLLAGIEHADIVQGRTLPNPAHEFRRGPFSHTIWVFYEEGYYETCNIAYRREVLEGIGGFDETYRKQSNGEDVDLAWRAKESGAQTAFAEDALVLHDITPSRYRSYLREIKRRPTLVRVLKEHPQARAMLRKRVFFRPTHAWALASVAALMGVAAFPRSPLSWAVAVVVGLVYAWKCRQSRAKPPRRWQWLGVVPMAFVGELYEIAVMARASVRYRTLLL